MRHDAPTEADSTGRLGAGHVIQRLLDWINARVDRALLTGSPDLPPPLAQATDEAVLAEHAVPDDTELVEVESPAPMRGTILRDPAGEY